MPSAGQGAWVQREIYYRVSKDLEDRDVGSAGRRVLRELGPAGEESGSEHSGRTTDGTVRQSSEGVRMGALRENSVGGVL